MNTKRKSKWDSKPRIVEGGHLGMPSIIRHPSGFYVVHRASYLSPAEGRIICTTDTEWHARQVLSEAVAEKQAGWPLGMIGGGAPCVITGSTGSRYGKLCRMVASATFAGHRARTQRESTQR